MNDVTLLSFGNVDAPQHTAPATAAGRDSFGSLHTIGRAVAAVIALVGAGRTVGSALIAAPIAPPGPGR